MMLAVHDLDVRYGGIVALRKVSIEVQKGETVLVYTPLRMMQGR